MSKDLWFAEMERLMYEGASYESACDRAHVSSMERLYDQADNLRKRAREEGASSAKPTTTPQESNALATPPSPSDAPRDNARPTIPKAPTRPDMTYSAITRPQG